MAKTLRSEIPDQFGGVINEGALARYVERVERLHEERASLGEDIKAVMEEAKNAGFVPKIIRQMVRERKMEPVELQDHLALLEQLPPRPRHACRHTARRRRDGPRRGRDW